MAKFAGLRDPVTLDFEGSTLAYCVDAITITIGSLLGTSPVTAYVESATGIAGAYCPIWPLLLREADRCALEGGKTGITAIVVGLMFFVSVFFAPIFASIPSWATGSALVIVGSLMIRKYVVVFSRFPHRRRVWYAHRRFILFLHPLVSVKSIGTTSATLCLRF